MHNMLQFSEGLQILAKYFPDGNLAAEHDIIYAGGDPSGVTIEPTDLAQLDQLGWFLSEEFESWAKFT